MKDPGGEVRQTQKASRRTEIVLEGGLRSLGSASATVCPSPTAATFWASCIGQSREFTLRREGGFPDRDHPRRRRSRRKSCASRAKVGTLVPGAFADLLVVDGDPLKDLALLEDQGKHLSVIMKAANSQARLH